jgi:hypothetical protein
MAVNRADRIALDRTSRLALRMDRNLEEGSSALLGNRLAFLCGSAFLRGGVLNVLARPETKRNAPRKCPQ